MKLLLFQKAPVWDSNFIFNALVKVSPPVTPVKAGVQNRLIMPVGATSLPGPVRQSPSGFRPALG